MRTINLCLSLILLGTFAKAANPPANDAANVAVTDELNLDGDDHSASQDPKFQAKLESMLDRAEKSIKLLREQITQNQSAPFLANLYMQLGDLLSQKSTLLYYLQMEHDKNTDLKVQATKKFSPVVAAEKDAIGVYQQILKEFPKFDKRDKVMYRLALAQKSIDESAAFVQTAETLVKSFPEAKEAIQVQLLLGQYFYDQQDFKQAQTELNPVKDSHFPFERNAARYRLGLIALQFANHTEALKLFEQVATDNELKEEDNPEEVSLKSKGTRSNIKREALIDSVRAFTEVFKDRADPVGYYSRVAPTETLFQETIEKLAYRYIFLKKYSFAIKLLRTLCERTADPQKIVNIYQEVLLMIPIQNRIDVPVEEMQFVIEKYFYWSTHYTLSPQLKKTAFVFFETQIRELGTRSHALAKKESDPKKRAYLYERARVFYHLYLGAFDKGPSAVKIAINLADVYFNQGNYLESGSYYLRVFSGEFGPPVQKTTLIQNAILSLQKPSESAFYEQLRTKGLLVKAIRTYQAFDAKQKDDPSLNFTLAKTFYEQGYYDHALDDLLQFMKNYPKAKEVDSAADLILYYFNTRNDFSGLLTWTQRMLSLRLRKDLRDRLQTVRSKAALKQLDEQVKNQKNYDVFSQGKGYLQQALSSGDTSLRSAAFEQALARSKSEKDIETFLKAATAMAKSESKAQKRADIMNSAGDETLAITRFYQTLSIWEKTLADTRVPAPQRQAQFEKIVKLSLMLRDLPRLNRLVSQPMLSNLSPETQKSLQQEIGSLLESPVEVPAGLFSYFAANASTDEDWVAIYTAQFKAPDNLRSSVLQKIASRCQTSLSSSLCKWSGWPKVEFSLQRFALELQKMPPNLTSVEPSARNLATLLATFRAYEGSNDPSLDIMLTLATAQAYQNFAKFLQQTAQANKEVAPILNQKAAESLAVAKKNRQQCRTIINSSSLVAPINAACLKGALPSLSEALRWRNPRRISPPNTDPRPGDTDEQQKKLFTSHKEWKPYFDIAETYLNAKYWNHAAATAVYGIATFPQSREEFSAILGCAVLNMGLTSEAQFHLSKASALGGHKDACLNQIKNQAAMR